MPETTSLSPVEEAAFQTWVRQNRITDVDHPDSRYDYRGFWKATQGQPHPPGEEAHFPDTFKQHGHPTFSQESQYSRGLSDGGMWAGDTFLPQPTLAVSHAMPTKLGPTQDAIRVMALHLPKGPPAMAPTPPMTPPPQTPDDLVLKSLMTVMGHGDMGHPAQQTTVQALLEGLMRGQK